MSSQQDIKISAEKIIKILKMKENECNTADKDVIIFIGASQSGKTTTINAFNLAKYNIDDDGTLKITNAEFKNHRITGKAGASCSIFPRVFTAASLPFYFLDIQGYNDTRENVTIDRIELNSFEIQVIASILTEIAVKKTKSVSVLLVLNYRKYNIKYMQENGEMIHRLFGCGNDSFPMYVLFNRYYTTSKSVLKKFFQLEGEEKVNLVCDQIKAQTA